MLYHNYHKHDHWGNPWTTDVIVKPEEYCKRAVELGHTTVFTTNHGVTGNIFDWLEVSKKYNLKMIYGTEAYYVDDCQEKDNSNRHIIVIARNNSGVMQLNDIMTSAHEEGFYYKPRIDKNALLSLDPNNFIITTACVAGIWNNRELMLALNNRFRGSFFLEMQAHNMEIQKEVNKELLQFSIDANIPIIHANDSHYIYPDDAKYRDIFLRGKNRFYDNEDEMILDYPSSEEIFKRYKKQGILTAAQVEEALENTLVFADCSEITIINDEIKLPPVSENPSQELKEIINTKWTQERRSIPKERRKDYLKAIRTEMDIIEKTHMENYFLIDYKIVKDAQEKYGGVLTKTGRGSAPSFYTTKILGLTDIDRLDAPITLFPTRFMSIERILGSRSLPDIDLNTSDREPFIKATEDLLGKENCAWMLAWKPLQDSSAFRLYCKGIGKHISEYDDVAKDLDSYREDKKWKHIIEESKRFIGVVESVSESPCFANGTLIKTNNGYKPIEDINIGDFVLTHKNRYQKVSRLFKSYKEDLLSLKVMGSKPLLVTKNHPFLVCSRDGNVIQKDDTLKSGYKITRKFTEPSWKAAEELTNGDFVGFPVNNDSIIPKSNLDLSDLDLWWIIGRYIGDGWTRIVPKAHNHGQSYHTLICCAKDKVQLDEIEKHLSRCFNYTKTEEKTTFRYDISSKALYTYLLQFGNRAYNKHLTDDILCLPIKQLDSFLSGYFSADGYKLKNRNVLSCSTVSEQLALGLQQCIHKCYRLPTTLVYTPVEKIKSSTLEDGRKIVAKHGSYTLSFAKFAKYHAGFYKDGYIWQPFRKSEPYSFYDYVYNFSVEEDESYCVNNIAVHNCSMLLYDKPVRKELGLVRTSKGKMCCLLDGYNCDKYKYLKNDYLTVTVWAIIRDVCKLAGISIPTIKELEYLLDDNTFDIYKNGLTCTINQVDSDFATGLVKTYKPQSVSEMSAFVAIIRPGCASLLQDFINRKPYTTGVSELDELLVEGNHRMIYQELIMKYLIWLGIKETGSYDIIKKIAKKKFKEPELEELKKVLQKGWSKKVGRPDGFRETWTVVEQAARYSFNASHSLSYAYDSLYGAYLKSHYPLEYYTVALNYYADDSDRTLKLTKELPFFGISLKPIKFRYSKSGYTLSKEDSSIYKGMQSIKHMNAVVADEIYDLRENTYGSFMNLLFDLDGRTSINSRQLKILIELDFFEEFGDANYLMRQYELFDSLNGKSQIKKEKIAELGLTENQIKPHAGNETEKMFTKVNMHTLLTDIAPTLKFQPRTLKSIVRSQIEHLGYVDIMNDRYAGMAAVLEVDTKYAPKLKMHSLKNGTIVDCKIDKRTFNKCKLTSGDIIRITGQTKKPKQKRTEDGRYEPIPGLTEVWIINYMKIDNI